MASLQDQVIDYFVDNNSEEVVLTMLAILAYPSQGGQGFELRFADMAWELDGWDVNRSTKVITLDTHGLFGAHGVGQIAGQLKEAIEVEFIRNRESLLSRIGWGTVKLVAGVVETGVGVIGIITPEPGTTAAGVVLVGLGVNTIGEALSQYAGANQGRGVNVLEEGFARATSATAGFVGIDRQLGDQAGRIGFTVVSIAVGTFGAYRILKVPGRSMVQAGVGGQPGGVTVGRIQALYPNNRGNGLTIISLVNNRNQSFLRFVFQNGRLYANGRIVGVERVLEHESNWRAVTKGLLKLLWHGAKTGL